ncbi:MAG: hypothetical protein LW832_00440 [Parachlamydia sp.]|jgi:hypothetical protein|nr:hypothetical protein [Parachlamydia sp.]
MEFSIRTGLLYTANTVIGAACIYSSSERFQWLTAFFSGVVYGALWGEDYTNKLKNLVTPGETRKIRDMAEQLSQQTPGAITTSANAIALGILIKAVPTDAHDSLFVQNWSAFMLGRSLGYLFAIDNLRRSKNPIIVDATQNLVI